MEQVCTTLTSEFTDIGDETKVCYLCHQLYNCKSTKVETEREEKQWPEYHELLQCCSQYVWPSEFDERINWEFVMEEKIFQFCPDCISNFEKLFEMNQLLEEMHNGIRDFIESFSQEVLQLQNKNQFLYSNSSEVVNESISNDILTSESVDRDFEDDLQFSHFAGAFPTTGTMERDPYIEFKSELIATDFVDPSDTTDIPQLKMTTYISNELRENIPASGISEPLPLQSGQHLGRNINTTNMGVKSDLKTFHIVLTQLELGEVKQNLSKYKSVGDKNIKKFSVSQVGARKRKAAVTANAAIKKIAFEKKRSNSKAKEKDDEESTFDCSADKSLISYSERDKSNSSDIEANIISEMKKLNGNIYKKQFKGRCALKLHTTTDQIVLTSLKRKNQYKIAKRFNCKCCKFSCNFVKQLSAHTLQTGHENERKYQCPSCSRSFNTLAYLELHQFRHHKRRKQSFSHHRLYNRKKLKCKICGKVFRRKTALSSHVRLLHPPTYMFHECRICNLKFPFTFLLKEHYFDIHSGENYKCKICGKEYRKKYFLGRHRLKHTNWNKISVHRNAFHHKGYQCRLCGKNFQKVDRLRRHRRVHTIIWNTENPGSKINLRPKCNICDRYFASEEMLRLHLLIHTTFMAEKVAFFKYYKCCICVSSFESKYLLSKHKDHVHADGKYFECETCESVFKTSKALENHKNVYVNEDEYIKCQMCMHNFHSFVDFTYHFHQQHSQRLPAGTQNECGVCDENLKSDEAHSYKSHTGSLLKCKKCGKLFKRNYFPVHWKSHFLNSFKCEFCGKYFKYHISLMRHRRQHTGDLHCCKMCDKKYTSIKALNDHIRIVHAKNVFPCERCGKSFVSQYLLKSHMRRHTGDYPFKCSACGKQYCTKSYLNVHLEKYCINK